MYQYYGSRPRQNTMSDDNMLTGTTESSYPPSQSFTESSTSPEQPLWSTPSSTPWRSWRNPECSFFGDYQSVQRGKVSFQEVLGQGPPVKEQRPASRRGSFTESITEKLTGSFERIFRRSRGRKRQSKPLRNKANNPSHVNILDKNDTDKLNKFWGSVRTEDAVYPPTAVSFPGPTVGITEIPWISPIELTRLPSITESLSEGTETHSSGIMDISRLAPEVLDGAKKQRAIQDAKDMFQAVLRSAERAGVEVPPYDFIELIGKGASGRVYKCRKRSSGDLVAVKIINTDDVDYSSDILDKDDTIRDFRKEVSTLNELKDSHAKNVNMIHDAFDFQEQLWIVCDYCTGGSVRTLMRAQPPSHPGLEEQFIIPIVRELALAMKSVHDIGIIHRDIKCTNVYVTEDGEIQLGDFGIVGVMDEGNSKRRTIIGTPHYMPREMHLPSMGNQAQAAYGNEVDVWSFGCTVYEMATGLPPNANIGPHVLSMALANAPRLEGGNYSNDLRDFIAYCLNSNPEERPTAQEVLRHPYIANTQKKYPTGNLVRLIERYKVWEYGGGQRISLFMAGGAPDVRSPAEPATETEEADDWNFSTSDGFNQAFEKRYSSMMSGQGFESLEGAGLSSVITRGLTPFEKIQQQHQERSATRGERSLDRLWNPSAEPYELHTPVIEHESSDLPLRHMTATAPTRESHIMIDLDSADGGIEPTFNFDFGDIPTLKARTSHQPNRDDEDEDEYHYDQSEEDREKRATMEWRFPTQKRVTMEWTFPKAEPKEPEDPHVKMSLPAVGEEGEPPAGFRPMLKHTVTEPIGQFGRLMDGTSQAEPPPSSPVRDSITSMIDLDMGLADPIEIVRPSTASSATGSTMTEMTSGNPFDLEEDPGQIEIDRSRFSYHKQWQSEGGQMKQSSRKSIPMHERGSSLSSTDSELDRISRSEDNVFDYIYKPQLSVSVQQRLGDTSSLDASIISGWSNVESESGFGSDQERTNGGLADSRSGQAPSYRRPSSTNGFGGQQPHEMNAGRIERPEINFPHILAPHPGSLLDGADEQLVVSELDRLLSDLGEGLDAVAKTLKMHTGIEDDEEISETESGMESSSAPVTGDEDGF